LADQLRVSRNLHRSLCHTLKRFGGRTEVSRAVINDNNLHCLTVQRAFGRRDLVRSAWINAYGHADSTGKGLEACFGLVVAVFTVEHGNVRVGLCGVGNALKKLAE